MKKLLLIGGGGHCYSVLDCVLSKDNYEDIGIIDHGDTPILSTPVIGRDKDLPKLFLEGWTDAFISVGSIGNTALRRHLYNMVDKIGFTIPVICDSSAVIGRDVQIGKGVFIGKRAVINAGSIIGSGAIINTASMIEHDCVVGDFAHISPGTVLCGQVKVGADTHIGAGSVVRQQIRIGERALIGAGSVVVKDIPDYTKAFGNPCKVEE